MSFLKRTKAAAPRAAGFPLSDEVKARKVKGGELFLKNGTNLFRLSLQAFTKLSVAAGADGAFDLVGAHSAGGGTTVLASFGSQQAADNALERVSASFAGIGGGIRWMRWVLCIAAAYVIVSLLSGLAVQSASAAVAARLSQSQAQGGRFAPPAAGQADAAAQAVTPAPRVAAGGFNPHEQSLEELERLAKGGEYKFAPNIAIPDVAAPALNCDQSHAPK
jgi:hypothetical protein